MDAVIGVDVGSGSARAGIFDLTGRKLASSVVDIQTWRPQADHAQQSSADIWEAVCAATRHALSQLAGQPFEVVGIGFDATCSLVVIGDDGQGLSVDLEGAQGQDVILWADHRATAEADEINATRDDVLKYLGGVISPEMQTPKLLWVKRHLPHIYKAARYFFDLPDYLTWRATGSDSRSTCSLVCKWTYLGQEKRWSKDFFNRIGLDDLPRDAFRRIGTNVLPIGGRVGAGLTASSARALGLAPGTPVGVSVIDAHAGGIGLLGIVSGSSKVARHTDSFLALIAGTSSCHMAIAPNARFIPGVWGPYHGAMLPDMWLSEAGQSAVGSVIDQVLANHPATSALRKAAEDAGEDYVTHINSFVSALEVRDGHKLLTRHLHVLPDFNGNRSPHADPMSRAVIFGLPLTQGVEDLARLYLATLQGLAYGTREIIETLNTHGFTIDKILATGGATKNDLFLKTHADATGRRIIIPKEPDSVLLGAAILGALAANAFPTFDLAMSAMARPGRVITPCHDMSPFHDMKYDVFKQIYRSQRRYRQVMDAVLSCPPLTEA